MSLPEILLVIGKDAERVAGAALTAAVSGSLAAGAPYSKQAGKELGKLIERLEAATGAERQASTPKKLAGMLAMIGATAQPQPLLPPANG